MAKYLKLKQFLAKLVNSPIIIEQGTTDIWTWRKWSDGIIECWGTDTQSWAMTSAVGNTYYCNKVFDITDLNFLSISDILVTGYKSGQYFGSKVEALSLTSLTISARASASETGNITHYIYIKGRWSEIDPTTQEMTASSYAQKQMTKAEIQALIEASGNQFKDNDTWVPSDLT